jgi:multiple sugar transport system ATP-binding protein
VEVLHSVDLVVPEGELTVLLGPSGCGKSTLLRVIAGLEECSDGEVYIANTLVNDTSAAKRGCAMVFQNYALYPHKTVYNNIAFPLKMSRLDKRTIDQRVQDTARLLQLEALLDRLPRDLSGGERQRVAMGRAMIRQPKVFLFDEPLSNLDAELRVKMRLEISRLQRKMAITTIYVTHDQVEAMTLADRLVIMRGGFIEQVGAPLDVYSSPANLFVAGFIGMPKMNFLPVIETKSNERSLELTIKGGIKIDVPKKLAVLPKTIGIRPEHIYCGDDAKGMELNLLMKGVTNLGTENLGDRSYSYLQTSTCEMTILNPPGKDCRAEGELLIGFALAHIHLFDENGCSIPG